MFKSRRRKDPAVVGLELDPGYIAAAAVKVNGGVTVEQGAVAPLRAGIVRDGEVVDPPALADELRKLWEEHDLPRQVRVGVANQRIVVRSLDLPPLEDEGALDAAVRAEAPDHIPMPMDEAVLDWQHLGIVETPEGPRARVLIVAVRREMVDRLVGALQEAGLEPEGVDLSAFAMVRALPAPAGAGAVLYVNFAGLTNVAVANGDGCLFTRAATGGLDASVHALAERRGLTVEHARQWMLHVGLATPLEEVDGDPDLVAATRSALEDAVHHLADTVRNSLNFYRTQPGADTVERGVLTGPAATIPGLVERLSEQLKLPLEPALVGAADEEADRGRLTVAAGLAVEDLA
jgi:type IV pilus assembly protein PilM